MALRGHHLGHGAGHRPCAALCSAADERPAERLLRVCLAVDRVLRGDWVLDPGKSMLTCEDSLGKGGCWSLVVKCRTLDMERMQA